MGDAAHAGGDAVQLVRIGLAIGGQVLHAADAGQGGGAGDDRALAAAEDGDGFDSFHHLMVGPGVEVREHRHAGVVDHDGVPIGRGIDEMVHADGGAGAGAIVVDKCLSHALLHLVGVEARLAVGGTAGYVGDDHRYRPVRIVRRRIAGRALCRRGPRGGQNQGDETACRCGACGFQHDGPPQVMM